MCLKRFLPGKELMETYTVHTEKYFSKNCANDQLALTLKLKKRRKAESFI